MVELMINQEMLKNLIIKYFPVATETQIKTLTKEMQCEMLVMTRAKIRELAKIERTKHVLELV